MKALLTKLGLGAVSALAVAAAPVAAQNVVINNATLVTGDGSEPVEGGQVIVLNGEVIHAGTPRTSLAPPDTAVIDAEGAYVTPGIFATVTTLGIWDVGAVSESNDTRAGGSPFSAALDTAPIVNPNSQHILVHRAAGITRAATATLPSGSIFAGQGAIIDLDSDGQPVMRARAFQMVDLGEGGGQIAGGSRASTYALFRAALREAQALVGASGTPQTTEIVKGDEVMLSRFDAEALVPVVRGEQKLYVAVERAADIRSVLRLKREFPRLDLVLVGASEGWTVATEIAASGVPVIADGLDDLPSGFDQLASTQSNIGRMVKAGVRVAINAASMEDPRRLSQVAGNLVALTRVPGADGLSWGQAFAAITSVPAAISGLGGRAGVLANGALGDVVIWDGDPLEVGSVPTQVFIGGVEQPLGNHQSRLKERYRDLDESDLPKAYDW
ncbi:amidohydrolase family protein [Erythrobacter sp. JK5]|uniref:amidohydrolase family protein n=1 Tax=Erythrobacter sp. JK5 TaxID=2829500 RepID=UPI001BAC90F7|nr:amidohydrolase family protein [Erythrobacter sp. JK5]QUL37167.1 amidohydrolase family protein [Erythrobacter sp. JK5]